MKSKKVALGLLLVFLASFLTVSCSKPSKQVVTVPEEFKLEIDKQTYEIPIDKLAVVTLEENGSTGYTWFYMIGDESILTYSSDETKATNTDKNIVGAPVNHTWKFKALKTGTTTVRFAYCREWEAAKLGDTFDAKWQASIEKIEFTVNVK